MSNTNNEAVSTTHKPEFRFHSGSCSDHLGHRARKQKPPGDHILDQLHTFSLPIFLGFLVAHTEGMEPGGLRTSPQLPHKSRCTSFPIDLYYNPP